MRISDWSSDVCSSDLGRIDVLCNNAGGGTGAGPVDQTPVAELSLDDWRYTYAVSLDSAFLCAKHAVPHLEQIGRASCRERVCQYVSISVVAVSLKKKLKHRTNLKH